MGRRRRVIPSLTPLLPSARLKACPLIPRERFLRTAKINPFAVLGWVIGRVARCELVGLFLRQASLAFGLPSFSALREIHHCQLLTTVTRDVVGFRVVNDLGRQRSPFSTVANHVLLHRVENVRVLTGTQEDHIDTFRSESTNRIPASTTHQESVCSTA